MAAELKLTIAGTFKKGTTDIAFGNTSAKSIDVSGTAFVKRIQGLTTSLEVIDVGDTGTAGYLHIRNNGAVNVNIAEGTGDVVFATLKAGEEMVLRRVNVTYKAQTASSTAEIETTVIPD